jgi:hypothetical protein
MFFYFYTIAIDVFVVLIMIFVKLVFLRVIMQKNMMELIRLKNIVNRYEGEREGKGWIDGFLCRLHHLKI